MRIRTIKPEFFKHDGISELSPICRILFIGLWCLADSAGRLEDRPKRIKVEVLPYDSEDTDSLLEQLQQAGLIKRYIADQLRLIEIPSFSRHQRITGKEALAKSRYPASNISVDDTGKQRGNNRETPETTGNGRETEGKGKDETAPPEVSEDDASIPSESEVIAFGAGPACIPPNYCSSYHAKTTEKRMWLNGHRRLIDWKRQIVRWWAGDKATWSETANRREEPKKKVICTL